MKSSKVSIKTRSTSASLSFKGQATKHTTVKRSIAIFAGKAKVLPVKPRLFLIKITVVFGNLEVLKQAKESQYCAEYNFIFGIFAAVQIFKTSLIFITHCF